MRRNQRTAAIDYSFAVGFESVGRVVQLNVEKYPQEKIGRSIQNQFHARIIDCATAFHEAAAENAFVAFIEFLPVANHIATIVRFIRHHNYYSIALRFVQTSSNRSSKAVLGGVLNRP